MKYFKSIKYLFPVFFAMLSTSCVINEKPQKPNVLMICVDDLRPELSCYGESHIKSPNIDQLAKKGVLFSNSFCNVPVCGASRASLLTGIKPTPLRFVGYKAMADEDVPGHLSLPRYLKQNGYTTLSIGKVYHNAEDDKNSWTVPPMPLEQGNYINPEVIEGMVSSKWKKTEKMGPAWEVGNTNIDEAYRDGKIAKKAIEILDTLKNSEDPFFLAVGFIKPHLPFCAPRKYFDLYDRDSIKLAGNKFFPKDAPNAAFMGSNELRSQYSGVPEDRILPDDYDRSIRHAYFASVSYTDAMIGKVMAKLNEEGLDENTIVVLWGDHGWNLGEHIIWGKHNSFEDALRAPIIVSAPGYTTQAKSKSLVEFIDIYPSIVDLCGLAIPDQCDGKSFVPILKNPAKSIKEEVFCRWKNAESIHTMKYAYTEWTNKATGEIDQRMLYNIINDPEENINIVNLPENQAIVEELSNKIKEDVANR